MATEKHEHEGHHHEEHDGHGHSHVSPGTSERRLALSLVLNLVITLAEVAGGLFSNSLALLSDAVHNLSDASSLGVSWLAKRISRMDRTPSHSFGFKRAEVLASLVNTVALMGIGVFLLVEAARKFLHPEPVVGVVMLVVAVVGLLGNLFTAWLLHADSKDSLNIRSAYLHIVMDTLSSVGVIVAALLMMAFGWYWLDPLLTLAVSLYVLRESWPLLKTSIHILMQGSPEGLPIGRVVAEVEAHPDVVDMHHVHAWTTDGTEVFLEAHVTLCEEARSRTDELLARLTKRIREEFGIGHVTLQFEFACCVGGRCSGLDSQEESGEQAPR
jgi:cation diffusion facilitator family transporter